MIVLHAANVSGRICLWAEAPPGGGTHRSRPPTLPFDAGPDRLADAVRRADGGFHADPDRTAPLVAWLPVRGRRPIPSSALIAEAPRGPGRLRLRPWTVTGLALDPEEALTLLTTATGRRTLGTALPVSPDLAFWSEAVRLSARLVAGGHVVPGLVEEDGRWMARWDPVVQGAHLEALAHLSRKMPPAARALVDPSAGSPGETPPDTSPLSLVRGFVARTSDHLLRSSQWPDGILPHSGDFEGQGRPSPRRRGPSGERPVEERWLEALRAPDPEVEGDAPDLLDFRRRLVEWRRPLTRILDAPWRLCFRLREPDGEGDVGEAGAEDLRTSAEENGAWNLDYLLQDAHDPSLLLPLEGAWEPGQPETEAFLASARRGSAARSRATGAGGSDGTEGEANGGLRGELLQALGQAARLSPRVEESLDGPRPTGLRMDARAAHGFLREEAPLLREAGFGVQLPAWWTGERARLKPSLRVVAQSADFQAASGLSLDGLVEVSWEVVLGGEALSRKELEALARLKAPLVRLRGRWVEVDGEELTRLLAELDRVDGEAVSASRLARMALGAEEGPAGLRVDEVRAEGQLGELMGRLQGEAEFETLPAPDGLRAQLRPYQERGYSWLAFLARWGLGACLADDMGLGKTVQTLALVQRDREEDERPVLVVCPTSVVTNWKREAARFTPSLRVRIHHGPDRASGQALEDAAAEADLVVTTYALLHRDEEDLGRVRWRGLVLDEAQNIKNPGTRRARAARSLAADYRVALTGTPVENHVGDLWSIMEVLNPGLLGTRVSFRERFFLPIQTSRDPEATRRLRRITGPFVLRRLKTDRSIIQDLPERIESRVFCNLTREQASLYAAVLQELEGGLAEGAEGIERKGLVLATLTRLKQVCNHPAHFLDDGSAVAGRSGKVERIVALLDEILESGGRALVFTQYTRMGEILQGHLQDTFGREVPFLHGGVSRSRRERMVDRFHEPGGPEIFLLSLKAGGTGLNLTAANHVFLFDRWWNPAVETQAADRAYRIGQKRNVQVHSFLCAGTLEEQIDRIIEDKREVARNVVGSGEGWLTELSNQELREVLALRPEAEGEVEDEGTEVEDEEEGGPKR
jgi:SNF2 family DNA or RNA helicase